MSPISLSSNKKTRMKFLPSKRRVMFYLKSYNRPSVRYGWILEKIRAEGSRGNTSPLLLM